MGLGHAVRGGPEPRRRGAPRSDAAPYEGTFGGPIIKDHIWFFTSGRYQSNAAPFTLPVSAVVVAQDTTNKRGSLKFTGSPIAGHTIQGEYFNNPQETTNASGLSTCSWPTRTS